MKKLILIGLATLAACNAPVEPDNAPNLRALSTEETTLVQSNNGFAFDLFRQIQAEKVYNNIFFSPISVTWALSMAMNGGSDSVRNSVLHLLHANGTTPDDLNAACKNLTALLTTMDRTVELDVANSVWVNQQFHLQDAFATTMGNYYDAKAAALPFGDPSAAQTINQWAAEKTQNRITDLLSSTSSNDALYLVNAIYFKGTWTYQFDKSKTVNKPFRGSTDVPTMWSPGVELGYLLTDSTLLVDLPYGNKQFSMTILMPQGNYSLSELGNALTNETFYNWLSRADTLKPELELPKFTVKWKRDLLNDLTNLGMVKKGFPRLLQENLALEVSKVIHQSFVEVAEEGTEAAAATAVGISYTSALPHPQKVQIDRPFYYFIRERHSNTILFMGRMVAPAQ
ncbi:MAG: serpin family protein [Cyclobacteriaceae bacterium]